MAATRALRVVILITYWLFIVVGLVLAACGIFLAAEILTAKLVYYRIAVVRGITVVGISCVALTACIVIHEFGHVVAAWVMSLRVLEVRIGQYNIVLGDRIRAEVDAMKYGAHVLAKLPTGPWARSRMAIFILGGPAANLLLAAILFTLAGSLNRQEPTRDDVDLAPFAFQEAVPERAELVRTLPFDNFFVNPGSSLAASLNLTAMISLFLFVFNLIALDDRISDGRMLRDLFRLDRPEQQFQTWSAIQGKRPSEWDSALVQQLAGASDASPTDLTSAFYLYFHHLDAGRYDDAARFLTRMAQAAEAGRSDYSEIWYELAYFWGRFVRDVSAAKNCLGRAVGRPAHEPQTRLRAEAAVLLAEGKYAEARDKAWQAIALMHNSMDLGGAIAEREWLAGIAYEAEIKRRETSRGAH